jgi:hypothetical protein
VANGVIAIGFAVVAGAVVWAPLLAVILLLHYGRVCRAEERMLQRTFGSEYEAYRRRVPRCVPRLADVAALDAAQRVRREARIVFFTLGGIAAIVAARHFASALPF